MIKRYKVNQFIKESPIRLIDENGQNLGVVPLEEAVKMAIEKQLDLVEVSENTKPPVCRLIDFAKFRYTQQKAEQKIKAKKKSAEFKMVRISYAVSPHDLEIKAKSADKFLEQGSTVKVEMRLKGREKLHGDVAGAKFKNFLTMTKNKCKIVQDIKRQGNNLSMIITRE